MEDKKSSESKPRILAATDLVHLNEGQRLSLLGGEQDWLSRRDFLQKLLGTAALIAIPAALLSACKSPERPPTKPVPGASSVPMTSGVPTTTIPPTTASSTTTTATQKTTSPPAVAVFPKVIEIYAGEYLNNDSSFQVYFDRDMDTSRPPDITVDPKVPIGAEWREESTNYVPPGAEWTKSNYKKFCFILIHNLVPGKTYELRIGGTLRDVNGNPLDGNGDGVGGDDLSYRFLVTGKYVPFRRVWSAPKPVPPSTSPSKPSSPGCSGQCASWGGAHCFCEVQCGCQLYRI